MDVILQDEFTRRADPDSLKRSMALPLGSHGRCDQRESPAGGP